ncbi:MAG: hypothetical protein AAB268_00905 [Elusimicrobiota bacterium]
MAKLGAVAPFCQSKTASQQAVPMALSLRGRFTVSIMAPRNVIFVVLPVIFAAAIFSSGNAAAAGLTGDSKIYLGCHGSKDSGVRVR